LRVMVNHRLTCSPLNTEQFLILDTPPMHLWGKSYPFPNAIYFGDLNETYLREKWAKDDHWVGSHYGTGLYSANGPNRFSSEYSGKVLYCQKAIRSPQYELSMFSILQGIESESLSPDLRADDGVTFILGFRAGNTDLTPRSIIYSQYQEKDPIFSFHATSYSPASGPDSCDLFPVHEFTAIGCIEQYQACLQGSSYCSSWNHGSKSLLELKLYLVKIGDPNVERNSDQFHANNVMFGSVYQYMYTRIHGFASLSDEIFLFQHRWRIFVEHLDEERQWIIELQAWFETAFLKTRFDIYHLYDGNNTKHLPHAETDCTRILFHVSSYTNIDFIQFSLILSCLVLLCAISFWESILEMVHMLPVLSKVIPTGGQYAYDFCVTLYPTSSNLLKQTFSA